jgi:hypothetical protein
MAAWTGCIAGALTEDEFRASLAAAGLEEVEIRETHACTSTPAPRSSALADLLHSARAPGRTAGTAACMSA